MAWKTVTTTTRGRGASMTSITKHVWVDEPKTPPYTEKDLFGRVSAEKHPEIVKRFTDQTYKLSIPSYPKPIEMECSLYDLIEKSKNQTYNSWGLDVKAAASKALADIKAEYTKAAQEAEAIQAAVERLGGTILTTKHNSFAEYMEDLRAIYIAAATEREALENELESIQDNSGKMLKSGNDREIVAAKAALYAAEDKYKERLENLRERTQNAVGALREEYDKHVDGFYALDGAALNESQIKILNSGITLKESEVKEMMTANTHNPTMLRFIADYCEKTGVAASVGRYIAQTVTSNPGAAEKRSFDILSAQIDKMLGRNRDLAKVWLNPVHFDRICEDAKNTLNNQTIKPLAVDAESIVREELK